MGGFACLVLLGNRTPFSQLLISISNRFKTSRARVASLAPLEKPAGTMIILFLLFPIC